MTITTERPAEAQGTIERVEEALSYRNPFMQVHFDHVRFPDDTQGRYSRVTVGDGLGVMAVPTAHFRGLPYLGLVRQYRYPVGEFTWEFPRGGSATLSLAEAARELVEETGLDYQSAAQLGVLQPDTGILDTRIAVWHTGHHLADLANTHVESETGAAFQWFSHGEVLGMINRGAITCALTLAGYTLLNASGGLHSAL